MSLHPEAGQLDTSPIDPKPAGASKSSAAKTSLLDLVKLQSLMARSIGRPEVVIALIDGPVALDHPDLCDTRAKILGDGRCRLPTSFACKHGTFVAGVLSARRGSAAPAIAPGCTLLVRPIFGENDDRAGVPSATPAELVAAVIACVEGGARVVNISAALLRSSAAEETELSRALDHAARREVLIIAAAGNQGVVGSSVLTRHPWVVPVVPCGRDSTPITMSNLGRSIGGGLCAPGERVTSLGVAGVPQSFDGSSAAAPFVTGAAALLCSLFQHASGGAIRAALCGGRKRTIVPPLLDGEDAYRRLALT